MIELTVSSIGRPRRNTIAADRPAIYYTGGRGPLAGLAETGQSIKSARRAAALPSGGIFCYLLSVGIVAGATIGVFFGTGLSLLAQPPREANLGMVARQNVDNDKAGVATASRGSRTPEGRIAAGVAAIAGPPRLSKIDMPLFSPGIAVAAGLPAKPAPQRPITLAVSTSRASQPIALPPPLPAVAVGSLASLRLSDTEIAVLLARGDDLLRLGDVASARLFFKRAADSGGREAALRMAATFDPAFLRRIGAQSMSGDPTESRYWYGRARELEAAAPEAPAPRGAMPPAAMPEAAAPQAAATDPKAE